MSAPRLAALLLPFAAACGADVPPAGGEGSAVLAPYAARGRWADAGAISYRVEPEAELGDPDLLARAVARAAESWSATGLVGFRRAGEDEEPDVTLGWRAAQHEGCLSFLVWDGVVAHTGPIERGTFAHFLAELSWTEDGEGETVALFPAALHELGHVLGLGHSSDPEAVMHGQYDPSKTVLRRSDLDGLASLYEAEGEAGPRDLVASSAHGTRLVGARPAAPHEVARADLDGDGVDEVLVWTTGPRFGDLFVYGLDAEGRLTRTRGPFAGIVDTRLAVGLRSTTDGVAVWFQGLPDGRHATRLFDEGSMAPTVPWPEGRPLELVDGTRDADGDGRLD